MILNGNSRGYGQELARHLLNVEDNEHAVVHELQGFLAEDLFGAFKEVEAISLGTKCQQYLFSLSLNPPKHESVPVEVFETVIANIEQRLGRDLYENGKAWEKAYHEPVREAARQERAVAREQKKARSRSYA